MTNPAMILLIYQAPPPAFDTLPPFAYTLDMQEQKRFDTLANKGKTAQTRLQPDSYPALLPHFHFRDNALWFGGESGRDARPGEAAFARACTGAAPFAEITGSSPAFAMHAATARYLAWWPRPLGETPPAPPARAETIILAAHPDDAELSMGGWLLQQAEPATCLLVICFSTLSHTINGAAFPDAAAASQVRWDEAMLASRMHGAPVLGLDYPEFSIRHALTPGPLLPTREFHMATILRRRLYALLLEHQPARVFAPAAMGGHPDHRMLFEAAMEFRDEDFLPDARFDLYEDAPYAARYDAIDDFQARFEHSYLRVAPWACGIDEQLPLKLTLADVFRSQFKSPIRDVIERIAWRNARRVEMPQAEACELFWSLDTIAGLAEVF